MNEPLTPAATSGHRNASILGAFALVLAFALGVSSAVVPVVVAGQQVLPSDLSLPLLADLDTQYDPAIPCSVIDLMAWEGTAACPQAGLHAQIAALAPIVFLARAPPL